MTPYYEDNALISPVDGVVSSIEELEDSRFAYKVTLESDYSNVSVLRVPMKAEVTDITHFHGTRVGQTSPLFTKTNETLTYELHASEKNFIQVVHRVKQSIDTIHADIKQNTRILAGHRYGVMINGITEIYIPHNFRINVDVGVQVEASTTLLGYFS
jgi:phosphatidylserine decarboxylase